MATEADVFIIESLNPDDEGNGRFEGSSIMHLLKLHDKRPEYRYVRTCKQFEAALGEYRASGYRYLHISAHADREGIATTNRDEIANGELASMLGTAFAGKRLFLSACSMVHKEAAAAIIPATRCSSIVGPRRDIAFAEAAVFWPALYHLMFTRDTDRMTRAALASALTKVAQLFEVEIGFYSRDPDVRSGYRRNLLKA